MAREEQRRTAEVVDSEDVVGEEKTKARAALMSWANSVLELERGINRLQVKSRSSNGNRTRTYSANYMYGHKFRKEPARPNYRAPRINGGGAQQLISPLSASAAGSQGPAASANPQQQTEQAATTQEEANADVTPLWVGLTEREYYKANPDTWNYEATVSGKYKSPQEIVFGHYEPWRRWRPCRTSTGSPSSARKRPRTCRSQRTRCATTSSS